MRTRYELNFVKFSLLNTDMYVERYKWPGPSKHTHPFVHNTRLTVSTHTILSDSNTEGRFYPLTALTTLCDRCYMAQSHGAKHRCPLKHNKRQHHHGC
jgi:hypothetical protein